MSLVGKRNWSKRNCAGCIDVWSFWFLFFFQLGHFTGILLARFPSYESRNWFVAIGVIIKSARLVLVINLGNEALYLWKCMSWIKILMLSMCKKERELSDYHKFTKQAWTLRARVVKPYIKRDTQREREHTDLRWRLLEVNSIIRLRCM